MIATRILQLITLTTTTCLVPSCGLFSTNTPQSTTNPLIPPPPSQDHPPKPSPKISHWVFDIDSSKSTGVIDLSLDPKGGLLGAKPARGTTPLRGKIHAQVTYLPDGSRLLKISRVSLYNVHAMRMPFRWSRLVGSINVTIPPQVLKISDHTLPSHQIASENGTFTIPECHFTVGGTAQVSGSGLVLKKAVGNRAVDLTIRKTEPVSLLGNVKTKGNTVTLKIPNAVMHDAFDLEGTQLKLKFTGSITAHARVN